MLLNNPIRAVKLLEYAQQLTFAVSAITINLNLEPDSSLNRESALHLLPSFAHFWWARLCLLLAVVVTTGLQGFLFDESGLIPICLGLLGFYSVEILLSLFLQPKGEASNWLLKIFTPLDSIILGVLAVYPNGSPLFVLAYGLLALINIQNDRVFKPAIISICLFIAAAMASIWIPETTWHWTINSTDILATIVILCSSIYLLVAIKGGEVHLADADNQINELHKNQVELKLQQYQLSKYLSPALRDKIGLNRDNRVRTTRKKLTIFFSDIVDFTEIAEDLEGSQLSEILNSYLTEMSDIALHYGGTIDKFIGDGIMIFFGDPNTEGVKEDAIKCVEMALEMRRRMEQLTRSWQKLGVSNPLKIRFGINTGFCAVGNFGTHNRLDYTLLGTEVNIAARLESAAEANQILISESTYQLVKDKVVCVDSGEKALKGINRKVQSHSVIETRQNLGPERTYFDITGEGYSVYLDMDRLEKERAAALAENLEQIVEHLRQKKT